MWSKNIWPKRDDTTSNDSSSYGRSSTFPSFHSISCTSTKIASSFARTKSSGVKSTPATLAPVISLAVIAVLPVPYTISRTRSSGEESLLSFQYS
ncbi:MAG: hypothetical protein ABJB76_05800 [Candidatus Nitrosocosmicus sp.]